MELLAEGSSHTVPAEASHLDAWIGGAEMPFTATIDPPGVGQRIIQQIGPRETTLVVELTSMKILVRATKPASAYAFLDGL